MSSILIIYTGGTIGMVKDEESGALKSFEFDSLLKEIPEIIEKFEGGSGIQIIDLKSMIEEIKSRLNILLLHCSNRFSG